MMNFLASLQTLSVTDIIDIGIITFFIYLILVWFKKSRARLMLVGMVILGSVYVLARIFGLYLTTMVFQAFFAIFLIMIVVIFQEDIRHFFERVALWGMLRRYKVRVSFDKNVNTIASAMANLARRRIGALVVLCGRDPLDRYLDAGTKLDALLNQALLEAIFDPHTPTHDGAVIIEEGRLVQFGVHLPLSTNLQQIGHLGTRHAAALGLAERTDAQCIVVSEERGMVSLAEAGQIRELADTALLREEIKGFYQRRFPQKKGIFLRRFFAAHLLEKIIAVALACTLWFVFGHRAEIIRRDFVVPVEYRNLSSDKIVAEPKQREVTVTLSGSERAFSLLEPKELKASLDMSTIGEGSHTFLITRELIKLPAGLSIVNTDPDEIGLKVYNLVTLNVPVSVRTEGRLPSGITVRQIKIEPKEVAVKVASSVPKESISVSAEAIDLRTIEETRSFNSKLIFSQGVRLVNDKLAEVKVTIEVDKKE